MVTDLLTAKRVSSETIIPYQPNNLNSGIPKDAIKMKTLIDPNSFTCLRCGACCRVPGYVALEPGEAEAIAAFLGLDTYAFTEKYTRVTLDRKALSLTEEHDGRCVFLQAGNTCRIQPVKPAQCPGFPFLWRSKKLERGCPALRAAVSGAFNLTTYPPLQPKCPMRR